MAYIFPHWLTNFVSARGLAHSMAAYGGLRVTVIVYRILVHMHGQGGICRLKQWGGRENGGAEGAEGVENF